MPSELETEFEVERQQDDNELSVTIGDGGGGGVDKKNSGGRDRGQPLARGSGGGRRSEDGSAVEMEEEEDDLGGFIRIRSHGDGIFEDEDDDEDEFYDFTIPEVELRDQPSRRKRKQEISFIENELVNHGGILGEDEQDYGAEHEPAFALDSDLFQSRKRDRLPLYLLNPDDFGHDPKKQLQIRRAIITYRHHQDKKEQIIKLTEENKKLREYNEALKAKAIELSRCGCQKNQTADLEILDVVIPVVPPRMYVRGSRPVLAVPYNKCSMSPTSFSNSSAEVVKSEGVKMEVNNIGATRLLPPPPALSAIPKPAAPHPIAPHPIASHPPPLSKPTTTIDVTKPLINITSSRLATLNSKTLTTTTHNVVTPTLPKPPITRVLTNGVASSSSSMGIATRSGAVQKTLQTGTANRFSISGTTTTTANRGCFIPLSLAGSIKSEPGVPNSTSFMSMAQPKCSTSPAVPSSVPLTALVKNEANTPATATPVSRIVFAKKGNTSNAVQTASQLLFGTKTLPPVGPKPIRPASTSELNLPMTASQLALASRTQQIAAPVRNPVPTPLNNTRLPNHQGKVFRTASGHVLKVVQTPTPTARKIPASAVGKAPLQFPKYQPIAPKPSPALNLNSEIVRRQISNQQLQDMWKQFDDDDDDDEMAIIAAMNGTSPTQRNRKQTMGSNIVTSYGGEIELNKYQDIVFEEAD